MHTVRNVACLWLNLDSELQLLRLRDIVHDELSTVTAKVCALISERHLQIETRAKAVLAQKLCDVLRHLLEVIIGRSNLSRRRLDHFLNFFGPDQSILRRRDLFYNHFCSVVGSSVFSAFTFERAPVVEDVDRTHDNSTQKKATQSWPTKISDQFVKKCCARYRQAYQMQEPLCCAVCARAKRYLTITVYELKTGDSEMPEWFCLLRTPQSHRFYDHSDFRFSHPALDRSIISRSGVVNADQDHNVEFNICNECLNPLKKGVPTVPRHGLINGLYRGELPEHLKDITWLEEQVCALARPGPIVFRLFGSDSKEQPFLAKGNVCVHPQPTASTAKVLPMVPEDINQMIAVVFTSSLLKLPSDVAKRVFRVRKQKITDFLLHLREVNSLYRDININLENINRYPHDGVLPGIYDRIVVNQVLNPGEIFEEETAAFEPHPGSDLNVVDSPANGSNVHIENMGIYDSSGQSEPFRFLKASALRDLAPNERPSHIVIPRSTALLQEYANPNLFPMMFPTLFPLGIGGFDDPTRRTPISFRNQLEHFLDLNDPIFRRHQSFMFVALNIHQRRLSHLHTSLAIRKSRYDHVAPKIASLTPEILDRLAKHVEQEKKINDLPQEDKDAFTLVNEVSTISGNIPGSAAGKRKIRNDMRAYFGYFGMPHLYLTMNPNASHSPLFQRIFGDKSVNLSEQYPELVDSVNRRIRENIVVPRQIFGNPRPM